jgi:hypothetical protein
MAASTLWTSLYRDGESMAVEWASLPMSQWAYVSLVAGAAFGGDLTLMANGLAVAETGRRRLSQVASSISTPGMVSLSRLSRSCVERVGAECM